MRKLLKQNASCEKAPTTDNNKNAENIPQFISSQIINHSELVSVGKCPQKPTKPDYFLRRALPLHLKSGLKQRQPTEQDATY